MNRSRSYTQILLIGDVSYRGIAVKSAPREGAGRPADRPTWATDGEDNPCRGRGRRTSHCTSGMDQHSTERGNCTEQPRSHALGTR